MPRPRYVGCLLFVAHSNEILVDRNIKTRLDATSVKMYAVLPRIDEQLNNELRDAFARNEVLLLSRREDCPASLTTAFSSSRVEVVEMVLDLKHFESDGCIKAEVDYENYEGLCHLFEDTINFRRYYSDYLTLPFNGRKVIDETSLIVLDHLLTFGSDIQYRHPDGGTLLHFAVRRKEEQLIRLLLRRGAQVDARNLTEDTPLLIAVDRGANLEIVDLLVSHGADVMDGTDESNDATPLQIALDKRCRDPKVLNLLLEQGASASVLASPVTTLKKAIRCGAACLRCVLDYCPDLSFHQKRDILRASLKNSSHYAKDSISVLLEEGFDLSPEDVGDVGLLFGTVECGNLHLLEKLLSWGASVRATNNRGSTALHILVSYFDENVAQFLLDRGADINAVDSIGETPLSRAVSLEKLAAFKYLHAHGAMIEHGERLVHMAVQGHEKETTEILELLLATPNINVNATDEDGDTPILIAALEERKDFMEILLRHGAIIDPRNDVYQEIMASCTEDNKLEVMNILVQHGVDVQAHMKDNLIEAVERNHSNIVRFFLELDDPRAKTFDDFKIPEKIVMPDIQPNIVQEVLEHGYLRLQPIFESKLFSEKLDLYFSEEVDEFENLLYRDAADGVENSKDVLCNHVNALIALDLSVNRNESDLYELPEWCVRRDSDRPPTDWERQVEAMRNTMVGETNVSYYEVMDMSMSKVVRFLRNNTVPSEVEIEDVLNSQGFSMYLGFISKRLRKASHRKSLMDRGIKLTDFIMREFRALPHELKEVIIDFLSNQQLRILLLVCPVPPEN